MIAIILMFIGIGFFLYLIGAGKSDSADEEVRRRHSEHRRNSPSMDHHFDNKWHF